MSHILQNEEGILIHIASADILFHGASPEIWPLTYRRNSGLFPDGSSQGVSGYSLVACALSDESNTLPARSVNKMTPTGSA